MFSLLFKKDSDLEVGFMSGNVIGMKKFIRTSDGAVGVIVSNGLGIFKHIFPEDIDWINDNTISTKIIIDGISVINNNMEIL